MALVMLDEKLEKAVLAAANAALTRPTDPDISLDARCVARSASDTDRSTFDADLAKLSRSTTPCLT